MLLSFSHERMRPWITRGLLDRLKRPHSPRWEGPFYLTLSGERMKRQTIRPAFNPTTGAATKWADIAEGTRLDLWWKSRTAERCRLGTASLAIKKPVFMRNEGGQLFHGAGLEPDVTAHRDDGFWLDDGFNSEAEAVDYFVPREGECFLGYQLEW